MRKGIKFSLGAALAGVALATCPVQAAELGDTVTTMEPAVALIMPFDVTDGRASFELVSRIGGEDSDPIATHWSFWSESCDHLADVFICLTPRDTVVVDPTALQGQIQNGQENVNTGPVINLTGEKGFVTVKILVPGLHPLWAGEDVPLGGNRLYQVPVRLGHPARRRDQMNLFPHPFP